jgi:hypothetical protein
MKSADILRPSVRETLRLPIRAQSVSALPIAVPVIIPRFLLPTTSAPFRRRGACAEPAAYMLDSLRRIELELSHKTVLALRCRRHRRNCFPLLRFPVQNKIEDLLNAGDRKSAVANWQVLRQSAGKTSTKAALYKHARQHRSEYYKWERGSLPDSSNAAKVIRKALTANGEAN